MVHLKCVDDGDGYFINSMYMHAHECVYTILLQML